MNWNKYMKKVCADPEGFLKNEGGWRAFVDESEEDESVEEDDDEEFEVEDEEDVEDEDYEIE